MGGLERKPVPGRTWQDAPPATAPTVQPSAPLDPAWTPPDPGWIPWSSGGPQGAQGWDGGPVATPVPVRPTAPPDPDATPIPADALENKFSA